ncbi:cysteine hydrolase family protein [Terrihalobacillus insolitus]|uniref:cysteine hydrolase family protein n=1 Tax=Terrihalobacillus insolitus TaxID=2950438 RepID=UPI00234083EE|nr:cysteine hydrolase [Terrihalobacillus insolitus]MDC3411901.1 cysteine hydrolase [Terrihalobacillus insolitus]
MINPKYTALLVIDVQNDFCSSSGEMAKKNKDLSYIEETIPKIAKTIDQCRDTGMTIIFINTEHQQYTDSQTWGARGEAAKKVCTTEWGRQLYKLELKRTDIVVSKNRYSAFIGTNLDLILRSNKIEHLLFAGFTTNVCVESTVREGFMRDYSTITLSDCTASYSDVEHKHALHILSNYFGVVMTWKEVFEKLTHRNNQDYLNASSNNLSG